MSLLMRYKEFCTVGCSQELAKHPEGPALLTYNEHRAAGVLRSQSKQRNQILAGRAGKAERSARK